MQNIDYKLNCALDRIKSIYDILAIFKIDGINITDDYWIGVFQQDIADIKHRTCTYFVRELNKEMAYDEFISWCKKENKSTYKYINVKTNHDEIEYNDKRLINRNIYERKIVLKDKDSILLTTNKDVMAEKLGMYILSVDSRLAGGYDD